MKCRRCGQALNRFGEFNLCMECSVIGETKKKEQPLFNCRKCGEFRTTPRCPSCGPEIREFPLSDFLASPIRPNGVTLNIDYAAVASLTLKIGNSSITLPAQPRKATVVDLGKPLSYLFAKTVFFRCGRWGQFAIFNESEEMRLKKTLALEEKIQKPPSPWEGPIREFEIPVPDFKFSRFIDNEKPSEVVVPEMPRVINLNPRRKIDLSEE